MNTATGESLNPTGSLVDRRLHPRYRFSVPVSVTGNDCAIIPAITLEISEGGLSAVLASPLSMGATVKIYPVASDTVTAQVRRQVGKIYGFQFLNLTPEQTGRLRNICSRLPRYPSDNRMGI
jgi:hypothetical protein